MSQLFNYLTSHSARSSILRMFSPCIRATIGIKKRSYTLPESLPYGEKAQPVELGPADSRIDGHYQVEDVQLILQYKLSPKNQEQD